MILIGQYDSPFVRRVAVTLQLLGIEFEHRPWSVWRDAERLAAFNPLRRVPTLVLPDGTSLVETWAIVDYLEELAGPGRATLPASGSTRRDALRLCALSSGLADKSVALFYETKRHEGPQDNLVTRAEQQISDTLNVLEAELARRSTPFFLGSTLTQPDIALACALRFTAEAHPALWPNTACPHLQRLAEQCEAREEFRAASQALSYNAPSQTRPELELFIVDKNDTSWSMRPWLLLAHHGIPFRETSFVAADPETPREILAVSPNGKVPALRIDGQTVWESLAIIETIADLFPALPIWPEAATHKRQARAIAAEMHAGFAELRRHCPMNLALRTKVELEPARRKELARFEQLIASARASHAERGAFLFGEFCAADAMLAPVATRIRSYGIEVNAVTQAWMDAVFTLPAFQRWEKEAESERAARPVAEAIGVPFSGSLQERIPAGPCYAVIFSSQLAERTQPTGKAHVTSNDTPITSAERSYEIVGERMVTLARASAGYLGHESTRDENGFGITVSYWSSLEAIAEWRSQSEHKLAQQLGRQDFYQSYNLRVARVEKHRVFSKTD